MMISFKKSQMERLYNHNEKNVKQIDYNIYIMTGKEKLFYISIAAAGVYILVFIFFRNHAFSALLTPLALMYPRIRTEEIIKKRKNELNMQFKDLLYCLSSSLSAGKSIEMSFKDALRDLAILYSADESIIKEIECIVRKIEMNETVESVLDNFSKRAHIDDIDNFVDVFQTCKRTGGNIVEIIKNTSNIINDKIEIQQEIDTMLAERKLERKILNLVPILLIVVLSVSAYDYMEPVFNTFTGRVVMSISIVLLTVSYLISKRIMDIKL